LQANEILLGIIISLPLLLLMMFFSIASGSL
jgi:hypothetical protein